MMLTTKALMLVSLGSGPILLFAHTYVKFALQISLVNPLCSFNFLGTTEKRFPVALIWLVEQLPHPVVKEVYYI